jgi:hypothetical protein
MFEIGIRYEFRLAALDVCELYRINLHHMYKLV